MSFDKIILKEKNRILMQNPCLLSDCTHGGKSAHHHHSHKHLHVNNNNAGNNNNNTTNVNNNQTTKRQFSISEDGPTINEDDLDNLINQSINEWQQRQNLDKPTIDVDVTQTAPIIS